MTNAEITAALDGEKGQDILLNAPEISVWMTAFGCLRQLADIQEALASKKIEKKEHFTASNQMLVELAETADATHRFGVVIPAVVEPNYKKRIKHLEDVFLKVEFAPAFWRWYNWWSDYMATKTTSERTHLYRLVMERLPDVDVFRPAGDWLDYRSQPAIVLLPI